MYSKEREKRRVYVASLPDDIPNFSKGTLIPKRVLFTAPGETVIPQAETVTVWYMRPAFLLTLSVFLFATSLGTTGYSLLQGSTSVAAPIASVENRYTPKSFAPGFTLAGPLDHEYESTKARLLEEASVFIELDLVNMEFRYFKEGEVVERLAIISKGAPDTWWQVPAGLYTVDQKKKKRYSTFGNIFMPWSISFGGNYYLNGVPFYRDTEPVPEEYSGGGIRLADEDMERIYDVTVEGTPVLVREHSFRADDFLYTVKVDDIHAKEYLVVDIESNTVLAAGDMKQALPIASLTKLMTALVAAEEIDLEKNVQLASGVAPWVTTLIPRLSGSYHVSMHSLLQLLLLESSNEAAEVIAGEYGREAFIVRMNERADEIGLQGTTFSDPSGLDDGNISTTEDLFRLLQYILHNRGFLLELTRDQHLPTAYADGQFGELANFNKIDGVNFVAGKVGETAAAGQTSVSLHIVPVGSEDRLVAVILLGTDERTNDIKRLLTHVSKWYNRSE